MVQQRAGNNSDKSEYYDYSGAPEFGTPHTQYAIVETMRELFEETLLHTDEQADLLGAVRDDNSLFLWALDCLAHCPTGLGLIRRAMDHDWSIHVSDLGTGGFHLDIPEKELTLDHYGLTADSLARNAFFRNEFIFSLIRGLRDIWQEIRFGAMERDYRPEALLMLERVRAADADTLCVAIAWELRKAGFGDIWRHLLSSDIGDLASLYSEYMNESGAAFLNNKEAMATIFEHWFYNEARVNRVDHETLNALDMVLEWAEEQEDCARPFGDKHLDYKVVTLISCMPDGKPYLGELAKRVSSDPEFATIHDSFNEAHLFQIVHDMDVVMVGHVPFRDGALARRIFPDGKIQRI